MYPTSLFDSWHWMKDGFDAEFHEMCILIDGLMGIYHPGYGEAWVDYDQWNDGDEDDPAELSVCVFPHHVSVLSAYANWSTGAWVVRHDTGAWFCCYCIKPVCVLIAPMVRVPEGMVVKRLVDTIMDKPLSNGDNQGTIDEDERMKPMYWQGKRIAYLQELD